MKKSFIGIRKHIVSLSTRNDSYILEVITTETLFLGPKRMSNCIDRLYRDLSSDTAVQVTSAFSDLEIYTLFPGDLVMGNSEFGLGDVILPSSS